MMDVICLSYLHHLASCSIDEQVSQASRRNPAAGSSKLECASPYVRSVLGIAETTGASGDVTRLMFNFRPCLSIWHDHRLCTSSCSAQRRTDIPCRSNPHGHCYRPVHRPFHSLRFPGLHPTVRMSKAECYRFPSAIRPIELDDVQ
jgi:hypothetical protein